MRALAFGLLALAAGCRPRELDELEGVRNRACACETSKCAEAALAGVPAGQVHATPRAQGIANEIVRCVAKLKAAEAEAAAAGSGGDDGSARGDGSDGSDGSN